MKVTTAELRLAASALFDHLEESGQEEFEFAEDFYWDVPEVDRYNPYESPRELDMGQLSDDVCEIRRILSSESSCVGTGLVWLAAILRRVGEKAVG